MDVCVTYWSIYLFLLVYGKMFRIRMLMVITYVSAGTILLATYHFVNILDLNVLSLSAYMFPRHRNPFFKLLCIYSYFCTKPILLSTG